MGRIRLLVKDPDAGYYGTHLWLPRNFISPISVKSALEFEIPVQNGTDTLRLWRDERDHIAVPREFIPRQDYDQLPFPIHDITPPTYPSARFRSRVVLDQLKPDEDAQRRAFDAFMQHDNGILNIKCGGGKTTIALHAIAKLQKNALIIVNQGTILSQWKSAIERFLEFDGTIGHIKGNPSTWDWQHPITIATLQSLALYADDVSPDIRRWFGVVIWDECHHLSAPYFSTTAWMFPGQRYGLSATVRREDGTEVVYNYHIGDPFYKDLMQTVKPSIEFRQLPTLIPPEDFAEAVLDKRGQVNMSKLRAYIGEMSNRNHHQFEDLVALAAGGRKVLALAHTKAHLYTLHDMLRERQIDCGMCTGDDELKRRWESLRTRQVVLGTHQLVLEAIDEKSLDTLVWLTPFGSQHPEGGKNALQQGMGRIQGYRFSAGMKQPRVIIYDDVYIKHLHRMCQQLKKQLRRWPPDEGGPYDYRITKLYQEG